MLRLIDANSASTIAEHTEYKQMYTRNLSRSPTERIMPNVFNLPYYRQYGSLPGGYRSSIITPILAPNLEYQGLFAIADQVPLERPLPWDRKVS